MNPALKLFGFAVAPLVISCAIAVLMESSRERATLAAVPKQQAQEAINEKKAEGDRLFNQGDQQYKSGQLKAARQSYEQALRIYRSLKHPREGNVLGILGIICTGLGHYYKAIEYHEQSIVIFRARDPTKVGDALLLLGSNYRYIGNHQQAIKYHGQSLAFFQKVKDLVGIGWALSDLGINYHYAGNYRKAIEHYEQSLVISRKIKDISLESKVLIFLGTIYFELGDIDKAISNYNQGGKIALKSKDFQDLRKVSDALVGLGNILSYQGNYKEAIDAYENSLKIAQDIGYPEGEGASLDNLGIAYNDLGDYRKAIQYHEQSLKIFQEVQALQKQISSLINLGTAYKNLENYQQAIEYQQQSLKIARAITDPWSEGIALSNLGIALFKSGKLSEAETSLTSAIQIQDSLRVGLKDREKVSIFDNQRSPYINLQRVQVALNKIKSALETSDRGRARAFIELLAARFAGETLENTIAKQKVEKLSIAQIQQVAKTQAATLVQYSIVSDKDLYIYMIQPDGRISFRKADSSALGKSLNDFVTASRDGLGVRGRTDRSDVLVTMSPEKERELQEQRDRSLRQLHQLLIEPIADFLPKNETDRIIFMPQGQLFLVPFPALLNAQNQPLITQHTILTAPSIQTLDLTHKTAQNRPSGTRPALVVGNPTMPAVSTVIGDPPQRLTQLPGSETEAKAIARQLNTQAITGTNARKDLVMQKMQNAGIIHLATHGLLDSFKGDTPGAIALAPNGTGDRNDGLLTSGEIFDLKLNADLVVLSACDTGRGDITGDGVIGLSRSLFVAGVPSIIVSLWKVPDDPTAFLMTEFYKNWQNRKLNKAQALRQAMLITMKTHPNPRDWAAFTLIGEAE